MRKSLEEFELPEDELRAVAESQASGLWVRPLAQEVLTARAVIKTVLGLTHQADDEHSKFVHTHSDLSEIECPACWAEEIRDAVQPYLDLRESMRENGGAR